MTHQLNRMRSSSYQRLMPVTSVFSLLNFCQGCRPIFFAPDHLSLDFQNPHAEGKLRRFIHQVQIGIQYRFRIYYQGVLECRSKSSIFY
ncbi:hypothetical protein NPIL_305371 [Nephila pilipes]|uniref:Uncharacterized protein n=1 Tax=Nephila pilipes TaxID=299642 RepID=A0A8X6TDJ0_NEPPI|nr:hypothetical protein NPIL_305371 [Nephila pilipes]